MEQMIPPVLLAVELNLLREYNLWRIKTRANRKRSSAAVGYTVDPMQSWQMNFAVSYLESESVKSFTVGYLEGCLHPLYLQFFCFPSRALWKMTIAIMLDCLSSQTRSCLLPMWSVHSLPPCWSFMIYILLMSVYTSEVWCQLHILNMGTIESLYNVMVLLTVAIWIGLYTGLRMDEGDYSVSFKFR